MRVEFAWLLIVLGCSSSVVVDSSTGGGGGGGGGVGVGDGGGPAPADCVTDDDCGECGRCGDWAGAEGAPWCATQPAGFACGSYACDGSPSMACPAECASDDGCADGFACVDSVCE